MTLKCGSCGTENPQSANFCRRCSAKLRMVCDCWVKKQPYNCGQDQCPGYGLFKILKDRAAAE